MQHIFAPPLPKHKNASSRSTFHRSKHSKEDDLSVSNLRKLYSSLLEEMAPRQAEMGTGLSDASKSVSNIRWKNMGTITVDGDDDEGFDYSYTPDDSKKSWRLRSADGGGMNGVTGGDWSKDGIRRYYTGGAIARGSKPKSHGDNNGGEILNIGNMEVDISTMNGVGLSPKASHRDGADIREDSENLFEDVHQVSMLDEVEREEQDVMEDVNIADSPSESLEDVTISENVDGSSTGENSKVTMVSNKPSMTTFESLFHISPTIAWRLRSAYAPKTAQEHDLLLLGSEALSHRQPEKAEGIAKGLALAKNSEIRVCDGLWKVGELISSCEKSKSKDTQDASLDNGDIEAAEAVFAYFCEKNILPMLIDAILCRPPPLSHSSTFDTSPSPFSGATWTASVKAQILQVISMLLFNTTSPLTLTYLLSNNYMNELIMGILPLDQWKEEALEEILPPYVSLLRGLVMKLRGDEGRYCAPLLLCRRQGKQSDDQIDEGYYPLLFAAVQIVVSKAGSTLRDGDGCLVKTTAMNVVLNLCRVVDAGVRDVLVGAESIDDTNLPTTKSKAPTMQGDPLLAHLTIEQELLFPYICNSLKACYNRSVRLLMATLQLKNQSIDPNEIREAREEAAARHKDIASTLLSELRYWLGFLDDLLSCEIRSWNVRLCEFIMSDVIVDTVLLKWNLALVVLEDSGESIKASEEVKAKAEIRTSVYFIMQLLGMVEYRPLVKMVVTALLAERYPIAWTKHDKKLGNDHDFFVVSPILHSLVAGNAKKIGEEADAGAGGKTGVAQSRRPQDEIMNRSQEGRQLSKSSEMDHRALQTEAAELDLNELAEQVEAFDFCDPCTTYECNRHKDSLMSMLSGKSYPAEVTALAAILFAAILEHDAIDDVLLETLEVLPSAEASPFETAMADYLETNFVNTNWVLDTRLPKSFATAAKYVSSLGIMLLERAVYHTWTEDGICLDEVPFNHYYSSSRFIKALSRSLRALSTYSLKLNESEETKELFANQIENEIRTRYRCTDTESPRQHNMPKTTFTCSLSSYNPSNFIDDINAATSSAPSNDMVEASQVAGDLTLHFRSLIMCIQEFHTRFTSLAGPRSIANKRWCDEDQTLSFCTIEDADDSILAIGSLQMNPLPQVGTEIDIRGRTVFHGFEYKKRLSIVDASVMAVMIVIDPGEIYVGRKVRTIDKNKCIVDAVIPIRNVIASATEKSLLHVALRNSEDENSSSSVVKGGKLTVDFKTSGRSIAVKDCLDKYCLAYMTKKTYDIEDFLEKCCLISADDSKLASDGNETWSDFQQS